jgi:hypothetical protein
MHTRRLYACSRRRVACAPRSVFAEKPGAVEAVNLDRFRRGNTRFDQKLNFTQFAEPCGDSSGASKG